MSTSVRLFPLQLKSHDCRININVSGKHFSANLQNLKKYPNTLLGSEHLCFFYDKFKEEYFFDRDPDLFRFILNYYHLGKLHMSDIDCPGAFQDELDFFGIPNTAIDECCASLLTKVNRYDKITDCGYQDRSMNKTQCKAGRGNQCLIKNCEADPGGKVRAMNCVVLGQSPTKSVEINSIYSQCGTNGCEKFQDNNREQECALLYDQIDDGCVTKGQSNECTQAKDPCNFSFSCNPHIQAVLQYLYGILILGSSLCNTIETVDCHHNIKCGIMYVDEFFALETFFVVVFTIDFVVRFTMAKRKVTFIKQVLNIVDLLAILPYYLELIFTIIVGASDVLITFRVLRVLRLMKLSRSSRRLQTLILTLRNSFSDLLFLYFLFLLGILLFGGAVYYVEIDSSNAGNFTSIPQSLWFTCVTMVTTGYGDVVPVTLFGKIFAALCGLCGVLVMSLPIPIMQERKAKLES